MAKNQMEQELIERFGFVPGFYDVLPGSARAFGASDEELREACFMGGFTVQFSNVLTGMQYDLDKFRGEVDRGMQFMKQHEGTAAPKH